VEVIAFIFYISKSGTNLCKCDGWLPGFCYAIVCLFVCCYVVTRVFCEWLLDCCLQDQFKKESTLKPVQTTVRVW